MRCTMQIRRAGLGGTPCGFDLPAVLAAGAALDVPPDAVVRLLPKIEAGMIKAISESRPDADD